MTTKSIQKLPKYLTQKLLNKSKGIFLKLFLGILVASLFVPVFVATDPQNAVAASCADPNTLFSTKEVRVSKSTVDWPENFDLFMAVYIDKATYDSCATEFAKYSFSYYVYWPNLPLVGSLPGSGYINTPKWVTAKASAFDGKYAVTLKLPNLSLKSISTDVFLNNFPTSHEPLGVYGYFSPGDARQSIFSIGSASLTYSNDTTNHPVTDPNIPNVGTSTELNLGEGGVLFDALKFKVGIDATSPGLDADKYRNFYRITFANGGLVATSAGASTTPTTTPPATSPPATSSSTSSTYNTKLTSLSALTIPVWMATDGVDGVKWDSPATQINYSTLGQTFGSFGGNHPVKDLSVIAIEDKQSADKTVCSTLKFNAQQLACSDSKILTMPAVPSTTNLLATDHKLFPLTGLSQASLTKIGVKDGDAVLSQVNLAPTLRLSFTFTEAILTGPLGILTSGIASFYGFSYTANSQHVYFEVYKDKASLDAHKNDAPPAGVQPYSDVVSSSSTSSSNSATDLFNFLRKVISYIVLLLTSTIYWIFSIILVPILNALLAIRPYQDQFVNFIYPGWIIVRNIANIGFIVALLWMGLRTLFQVDDAGKTRGFILWLVLMALLVNFSLVIAQGVVGVADTVQAQFLPANSKVIEALGQKLMVDPIKFFRGQSSDANITTNNNFTVDSSASDITKPIVLLILAVAAFFSFVALIAFIMVRLVALWILYMLSPIAYVAKILPETKKYWDQWWNEFIKYAFTVPILAFFLNISALMATTFAQRSGDSVIAGRDPNYLFGNVAGSFTQFAITVISHFIVLFFLYAGMHFALKSGTVGAKQIVDGAKKGFDFVTKTVPAAAGRTALSAGKWAKDAGSDSLAGLKNKNGGNVFSDKSQRLIRSAARPIQAIKALKKGYFDNPKELMEGRFTDGFKKLTNQIQPWGEEKLFPVKWAWWKLKGEDSQALMSQADRKKAQADELRTKAGIMDDTDKTALVNERGEITRKRDTDSAQLAALQGDLISTVKGREVVDGLYGQVGQTDQEIKDLQDQYNLDMQSHGGQLSNKGQAIYKQLQDKQAEKRKLEDTRDQMIARVTDAERANQDEISIAGLRADIQPVFDVDQTQEELTQSIEEANKKLPSIQGKLDDDNATRDRFGMDRMTGMNETVRTAITKQADDLTNSAGKDVIEAQRKERPFSLALESQEANEAKEEQKKLVDLDYDQLHEGFEKALKENNPAMARAHLKQITDSGMLSRLLEDKKKANGGTGFDNNVEGLAQLVKQGFSKLADRSQVNIIREVSNSSAKNGNMATSMAVKSLSNGSGMVSTIKAQQAVMQKIKAKPLADLKKGDITFFNPNKILRDDTGRIVQTGAEDLNSNIKDLLKTYNNPEKIKVLQRSEFGKGIAKHILGNLSNEDRKEIGNPVIAALGKAAQLKKVDGFLDESNPATPTTP